MSLLTKTELTKGSAKVRASAVNARQQASQARRQASQQARQARQQALKAASIAAPIAVAARVKAGRGVYSMRAWAAPRLEQSGQALQDRVAPRVSAMLSSAARRIEPPRRQRRRWPFLVGGLVALGAAAGAAIFKWRSSSMPWQQSEPSEDAAASGGQSEAPADGKPAESNSKVRTR